MQIIPLTVGVLADDAGGPAERERRSRGGGRQPRRRTAMVVERQEAQRARSRRFAQADRSVARATPEAWAGGNIRPRGVAHDPAPPGAPLLFSF
jgi:hypothetical protein